MQTLVILFSLIIWALGSRTADFIVPFEKVNNNVSIVPINEEEVFVAGLSEGSSIGMVSARNAGTKGFISLNDPGSPAYKIILDQTALPGIPKQIVQVKEILPTVEPITPYFMKQFNPELQTFQFSWSQYDASLKIRKFRTSKSIVEEKKNALNL